VKLFNLDISNEQGLRLSAVASVKLPLRDFDALSGDLFAAPLYVLLRSPKLRDGAAEAILLGDEKPQDDSEFGGIDLREQQLAVEVDVSVCDKFSDVMHDASLPSLIVAPG
jgi:hypothetical protein